MISKFLNAVIETCQKAPQLRRRIKRRKVSSPTPLCASIVDPSIRDSSPRRNLDYFRCVDGVESRRVSTRARRRREKAMSERTLALGGVSCRSDVARSRRDALVGASTANRRRTTRRYSIRRASRVAPRASAVTHEEVLKRIEKAKETKRLDLAGVGLGSIPDEAYELTELLELQVSNNNLYELPEDFLGRLTKLERLGLAGNRLRSLPKSVGGLKSLRGIWAHGNCLKTLPEEIRGCESLRNLVVGGNRLRELPGGISMLKNLEELSAPGNQLSKLPELGSMPLLREIDLHGNLIEELPEDLKGLRALETFSLQGNRLSSIPQSLTTLRRLRALNLAENALEEVPSAISEMTMLTSLWLYSNRLKSLPLSMKKMPSLRQAWVEGNEDLGPALDAFIEEMTGHKTLKTLGVDQHQIAQVRTRAPFVSVSEIPKDAPNGYFKLVRWNGSDVEEKQNAPVLIVSFGSAPGVPNWGGLLKKLQKNVKEGDSYDVLYVCDVERSWYMSNDMSVDQKAEFDRWSRYLEEVCAGYERVLYIGDSMGASASLMFAKHATRVLAFCPQVDLYVASIRPSRSNVWFQRFKTFMTSALEDASADISVHTGSWDHDKHQASLLPHSKIKHIVHQVDSHRLALALDGEEKLLPIIQRAFETEIATLRGEVAGASSDTASSNSSLNAFAPWQTLGLK